jgi:hypothetical protein
VGKRGSLKRPWNPKRKKTLIKNVVGFYIDSKSLGRWFFDKRMRDEHDGQEYIWKKMLYLGKLRKPKTKGWKN